MYEIIAIHLSVFAVLFAAFIIIIERILDKREENKRK